MNGDFKTTPLKQQPRARPDVRSLLGHAGAELELAKGDSGSKVVARAACAKKKTRVVLRFSQVKSSLLDVCVCRWKRRVGRRQLASASAMPIDVPMNPMMDMMVNGALPTPMATQEITP